VPSWALTERDIDYLADGCALLGSGGGGESHSFRIVLKNLIADRGPIQVLDATSLAPDSLAVNVGFVGAPIVMTEKLFCERTVILALEAMSRRLGRPIDAIMPAEIGGANGLSAFIAAALLGVPVVDADGMGRAFPMNDMITYSIYGRSASPTIATTDHGEVVCIDGSSNRRLELLSRAIATANGSVCFGVDYPLLGEDVRTCAVLGSVSLARRIGMALETARSERRDHCKELIAALGGTDRLAVRSLIDGKVIDCHHEIRSGWQFGRVTIDSVPPGHRMMVEFQNEFLIAVRDGVTVTTTPDIISIVDTDTLQNITSDGVRYGQRVIVIAIEAPTILTTDAALAVVGPRAFGFDLDYRPVRASP
jgi:uncharacterized protein